MSEPKRKNMPRHGADGRTSHDVGGLAFGPIDRSEHDLALWEKRTDALVILMRDNKRRIFTVDAHRRMIESYGEQEYDRTTYYEKWIRSVRNLLVEQEVLTAEEIDAKVAEVRARLAASGRTVAKDTVPW